MLLMFLFQHNLYAVFREQKDRCCRTRGAGASLPFKELDCKPMKGV